MAGYDIYVHKQGVEGVSALNPESPANEVATNASRIAIKKTAMLGYGKLLANQTINTITAELKAGGNEQAATVLSNISKAGNMAVAAAVTGGLSLIPQTISSIATQVVRHRAAQRETTKSELEMRLKGSRSNFNQGRVHFD
jgi:hypothetical protein